MRRLLIVKTDPTVAPNGGTFLSFDNTLEPAAARSGVSAGTNPADSASQNPPLSPGSSDSSDMDADSPKRFNLLRSLTMKRTTSSPKVTNRTPTASPRGGSPEREAPPPLPKEVKIPAYRPFCFKFSLEIVDRRQAALGNLHLYPPRLPLPAQQFLVSHSNIANEFHEVQGVQPRGDAIASSRYSGRALAEWTLIVKECQAFFDRRRNEGVPYNKLVETPTLGVESFRKPG